MHFHHLAVSIAHHESKVWLPVLEAAQKFYIGDIRWIPDGGETDDMPRLPYPVCAFEFVGEPDHVGMPRFSYIVRDLYT